MVIANPSLGIRPAVFAPFFARSLTEAHPKRIVRPMALIVLNAGRMANKSNGKSACLPCHRFILPCGKTREPFSLAHEIERPGAVADDAGTVSRNLVSSTLSQSGVNEYRLTAARKGRISGRNEPNRTQSCDFWAQKPPILAQNGTRKSPLIMSGRREL